MIYRFGFGEAISDGYSQFKKNANKLIKPIILLEHEKTKTEWEFLLYIHT